MLFSFGNKTTVEPANGLTKTLLNDKTYGEAVLKEETGKFFNAGTQNAFAVRNQNGEAGNWIVRVNDDDAAAAAFVANPPEWIKNLRLLAVCRCDAANSRLKL